MRIDPDPTGRADDLLVQYLDYHRETILLKTDGLSREQLAQRSEPSTLTLGGLLNHLSLVEDVWLQVRFLGLPEREPWASVDWDADPDWDFRTATDFEPAQLRDGYREACDRSRAAVAGASSFDQLAAVTRRDGSQFSLRWVLFHLLEETARHAGHADLIREAVDGTVGE